MSDPEAPPLDEVRIAQVLDRHGVEYILVGGLGARLHGATRPTRDFDVCPAWGMENLRRLAAAPRELGANLRGMPDGIQLPPPTAEGLNRMAIGNWHTDAGYLDVLIGIPSSEKQMNRYENLAARASSREVAGCTIYVAALDDIITSKEIADRDKDRAALPELRALRAAQLAAAAYPEGIEEALHQIPPTAGKAPPSFGGGYRPEPPGRSLQ